MYEYFHPEILGVGDSSEPSLTSERLTFLGRRSGSRERGENGRRVARHRCFPCVWPKQSPGNPDPASLPTMNLLLSAALSFFPLWGSSSAVARLVAALRPWLHPPPGLARRPRSRLPGAAAAGRHRGRPWQQRGGAARGGTADDARLRSALSPLALCHRLDWSAQGKKRIGPAARNAAGRSGKLRLALYTETHKSAHCRIVVSQVK